MVSSLAWYARGPGFNSSLRRSGECVNHELSWALDYKIPRWVEDGMLNSDL